MVVVPSLKEEERREKKGQRWRERESVVVVVVVGWWGVRRARARPRRAPSSPPLRCSPFSFLFFFSLLPPLSYPVMSS